MHGAHGVGGRQLLLLLLVSHHHHGLLLLLLRGHLPALPLAQGQEGEPRGWHAGPQVPAEALQPQQRNLEQVESQVMPQREGTQSAVSHPVSFLFSKFVSGLWLAAANAHNQHCTDTRDFSGKRSQGKMRQDRG